MHAKYEGKWFAKLKIDQQVAYYRNGDADRSEVWSEILELPGQVRSNIGDPKEGNVEIYLGGTMYHFQQRKLVRQRKAVHTVLLLRFDVYLQAPARTLKTLADDGLDLDAIYETPSKGRSVLAVGAREGDLNTPQFWTEKNRLILMRTTRKTEKSDIVDIELDAFERCGGWVAPLVHSPKLFPKSLDLVFQVQQFFVERSKQTPAEGRQLVAGIFENRWQAAPKLTDLQRQHDPVFHQ